MTTKPDPRDENTLPPANPPGGNYPTVLVHNGIAHVSGHLPKVGQEVQFTGKVGADCSIEDARAAAELSALNCLASLKAALGSLDRVEKVLKVVGYVASADGFNTQPHIVDAASDLIIEWLGFERGRHARSAIGVYQLPRNVPVEIDMMVAVKPE